MKLFRIGLAASGLLCCMFFATQEVEAVFPGYNGKIWFGATLAGGAGFSDIYSVAANGSDLTNVVGTADSEGRASWAKSGEYAVFASNDGVAATAREIYRMNKDGSGIVRLTNNSENDDHPHISPDGSRVIFTSYRDGNGEIYTMDLDGGNVVRLTNDPGADNAAIYSPDGLRIIFTSNRDGDYEVYTMDNQGGDVVQLTHNSVVDTAPHYSPDGTRIVWFAPVSGTNQVLIMDHDGGNVTQLTYGSPSKNYPTWSPDGTKILFNMRPVVEIAETDLHIMDPDGQNVQRLTTQIVGNVITSWQPIANTAPVLTTKSLTLASSANQSVDVLAGATDEEALSPSNVTITSNPSHGSAVVESGKIKYAASNEYAGSDSLEYKVCDSFMLDQKCSSKVLGITVTPKLSVSKIGDTTTDGRSKVISISNTPTFSGQTTPLAEVRVEIHSDPIVLTTTADSQGYWSVTPSQSLPAGDHTVYISATLNGQTTQLDSLVLGIQATIPDTGADYSLLRWGGLALVAAGCLILLISRRRYKVRN